MTHASDPTPLPVQERTRQLAARRTLLQFAGVILLFWGMDALITRPLPLGALAVRALWAGGIAALAGRLPGRPESLERVVRAVVVLSVAGLAALVRCTGGTHNPAFASLAIMPIAALVLTQDDALAVHLALATDLAAMAALLLDEPVGWRVRVQWLGFSVAMGLVALYGTGLYRRRREAELASEQARIDALERLAASERRRAEAERLAAIGQVAAGVAHEINNPLAYVQSNLAFLQEQLAGAQGELREALQDSVEGVARIGQIVRDLRSFSRADEEELGPVEVRPLVEEALRLASPRLAALPVELELPPGLGPLVTSRGRVLQVLVNLLVNAADALEGPAPAQPPRIRVRAWDGGGALRIAVEDTGPGIPPELLGRVFEPFFTTKPSGKGTGLGLSLSSTYVQRLGGRLTAANRPDGGACFTVEFPAQQGA